MNQWNLKRLGMKAIGLVLALTTTGCVSTLSCGVDDDESWVQLENVRDTATVRNYAELCGFAYSQEE